MDKLWMEGTMATMRRPMTKFDGALPTMARTDPMGPPEKNLEVRCLHCDHVFYSDEMVWYRGMWCCPKIACGGTGFLFDIFPVASVFWKEDEGDAVVDAWGVMSVPLRAKEAEGFFGEVSL
jgi:hypothetical protein